MMMMNPNFQKNRRKIRHFTLVRFKYIRPYYDDTATTSKSKVFIMIDYEMMMRTKV